MRSFDTSLRGIVSPRVLVTTLPLNSTSRTHFKASLTQAPTSCSVDSGGQELCFHVSQIHL